MGARQGVRHETAGKTGVAAMVACQKEEGWRLVNSEAKRKGVEVPERRGCWGGTGSGRGGGIVYQGRDTVRRAGRGQGRAEVSRGVSDEVSGVKFGRGVSEKKGGCVLGREIADNCRGGERRG